MSTEVNYIPFRFISVAKPGNPASIVFENLNHLPWKKLKNGSLVVDNYFDTLPSNSRCTAFQNSDDTFVIILDRDTLSEALGRYEVLLSQRLAVSVLKQGYLFDLQGGLKAEFLAGLNEICDYNKLSGVVVQKGPDVYEIHIIGLEDRVKMSENKLRILMDQFNPLIYLDYIELETLSLLPLIGGVEFNNYKQVAKQANCHLYLPNILPNDQIKHPADESLQNDTDSNLSVDTRIYISGLQSQVVLTKTLLNKIKENITSPYVKGVPVDYRKKTSLMLSSQRELLVQIMVRNECFIQVPSLGSTEQIVLFQANNLEALEKAIQEFISLMSESYNVFLECENGLENTEKVLCDISSFSGCLIQVSEDQRGIITGSKDDIKKAISLLSNYRLSTPALLKINCVKHIIELDNDEREFIGGKKNGKLLKIMNNSDSIIKIYPYTDFSFLLEVNSPTLQSSVVALQMIEAELPNSTTFNIPESFHRQIIGVGGTTIQTIMRRYNVFIKFSNSFIFDGSSDSNNDNSTENDNVNTNHIQSFIRKNNVIVKCPTKNGSNIPFLRQELEKLVQNCCNMNYFNTYIRLSRSHWRLLANNSIGINNKVVNLNSNNSNSNFVIDLEKKTNTFIKFPEFEPTSLQLLEINGVEKNSEQCAKLIESILPKDYEFKLAYNQIFQELCLVDRNSKLFLMGQGSEALEGVGLKFLNEILVPFKLLYNIEVQVFYDPKLENDEEDLFEGINNEHSHTRNASLSSIASNKKLFQNVKHLSPLMSNFEFSNASTTSQNIPQFHSIILSYFEQELDKQDLNKCLEILTSFLRDHKIIIIDKNFNDKKSYIVDGTSATNTGSSTGSESNKENSVQSHDIYYPQLQQPQHVASYLNKPQTYGNYQQLQQQQSQQFSNLYNNSSNGATDYQQANQPWNYYK